MRIRHLVTAIVATMALVAAGCGDEQTGSNDKSDGTTSANGAEGSDPETEEEPTEEKSSATEKVDGEKSEGGDSEEKSESGKTGGEKSEGGDTGKIAEVPALLDFEAKTVDGADFNGADLAGKPVALWFWAPWCTTCRGEAPTTKEISETFDGEVSVVGVAAPFSQEADRADMQEFVATYDLGGIPHLNAGQDLLDRFQVGQQATWVLLDADGEPVHNGPLSHSDLESRLSDLTS